VEENLLKHFITSLAFYAQELEVGGSVALDILVDNQ
jgi:hypothetical protein